MIKILTLIIVVMIFSLLKGKGSGECSAGMYDLIEADKKALKIALEAEVKDFENIRLLSARMLLVTRGEDARDKEGVLKAFKKHLSIQHFLMPRLVYLSR